MDEQDSGTGGGESSGSSEERPRRKRRRAPIEEGATVPKGRKAERSVEEAVEAIYRHAADLIRGGMSASDVEDRLIEQGLDRDTAATVVDRLMAAREEGLAAAARKNMLYGGLWCGGGLIVTLATYSAASGGGSYVVAWGAIIFGGIQFFRGLSQSSSGSRR